MSQYSRGVRAKKNLGQHFLVDESALSGIAAQIDGAVESPFYMEIGPGTGNLTEHILRHTGDKPLLALERDSRVIPVSRIVFRKTILRSMKQMR